MNYRVRLRNGLTALAVLILAIVLGFYRGIFQFNHPSPERFPVRGVDVSHHQGTIDWFRAGLHGVDFAYLKATEGTDFRDNRFAYNWDQCRKTLMPHGAYHFFSPCSPGREQARNFLRAVPPDPDALPPALDLEFDGGPCQLSRAQLIREVSAFEKVIQGRFPGPPLFYVTPTFYKRYFDGHRSEFPPHRLWIRNVLRQPSQTPCDEWTFWQYSNYGRQEGIPGPVDVDVFCADRDTFRRFRSKVAPGR